MNGDDLKIHRSSIACSFVSATAAAPSGAVSAIAAAAAAAAAVAANTGSGCFVRPCGANITWFRV